MPTIYHDLMIKATPQSVFQGVSQPDHLINWWPLECSGKAEAGTEYNFFFGPKYDWYGKVVQCKESKAFHIKMTRSEPDWAPTTFGFDMEPVENQTQLRFWHKDWKATNQHFRIASFCWAMLLNGLKNYLKKGIIVPFEERS